MANRKQKGFVLVSLLLVFGTAQALGQETPEEVVRRMHEKSESFDSLHMTTKSIMKFPAGEREIIISTWSLKDGEFRKIRTETEISATMMGATEAQKMSRLLISDGKIMWQESESAGVVQVVKLDASSPEDNLNQMLKMIKGGQSSIKEPETIDGQECIKLEIDMKKGPQSASMTIWYGEEHGLPVKMVIVQGQMGSETTMKMTDFKPNIKVDDSKFTYVPPEGVKIQNNTTSSDSTKPELETPPAGKTQTPPVKKPATPATPKPQTPTDSE